VAHGAPDAHAGQSPGGSPPSAALSRTLAFFPRLLEPFMRFAQRLIGAARMPWLFLTPNLLILGTFTFLPIIINFYYAFTGGVKLFPSERPFVGLENLQILFECGSYLDPSSCRKDIFWHAVFNTAKFAALQVGLMVFFSVLTALVLNKKIMGRGFWRGVFFYPVLLSPVVVALIWKWILQSQGLLNGVIVGLGGSPTEWLTSASWMFFFVILVSIWAHMGFYTLIVLASLQAIPADLYDAAQMDSASPWRVLSRITLPLLMPNLLVVIVLALIRAVQIFDEVFVLTGGGPGTATTFLVQFIYQTGFASEIHLYGLAAAASLVLAIALLALTLVQLKITRGSDVKDARGNK
jgi:alpha-1,4-digalacturonate transport system permease protein